MRVWLLVLLAAVTATVVPGWSCPRSGAARLDDGVLAGEELRRPEPPDHPVARPPTPAGVVAVKEQQPELSASDFDPRAVLVGVLTPAGVTAAGLGAPATAWAPWSLTAWRRAGYRARAPPA